MPDQPNPPVEVDHGPKIVNGWYVDSKGGLHYYYRYADGTPADDPPRAT